MIPTALAAAIAQATQAFSRPLGDAEERALSLRARAESGDAALRDQAGAASAIESDLAPFRQRFQIARRRRRRAAAASLRDALGRGRARGPPSGRPRRGGERGRRRARTRVLLLAAALDGRGATGPLAADAMLPAAAPRTRRALRAAARRRRSPPRAALLADARQSLANARKNEAMRALRASAGPQWAAAMALGFALLIWSRRAASPALGVAAALAAVGGRRLAGARAVAARGEPRFRPGARRRRAGRAHRRVRPRSRRGRGDRWRSRRSRARPARRAPTRLAQSMSSRVGYPGLVARDRSRLAAPARPVAQRPRRQPLSRALPPGPPVARHAGVLGRCCSCAAAVARLRLAALGRRRSDRAGERRGGSAPRVAVLLVLAARWPRCVAFGLAPRPTCAS